VATLGNRVVFWGVTL